VTKKLVFLVVALILAVAAWFGVAWYNRAHDTPERADQLFMQRLANRDAGKTFEQLSSGLQDQYRADSWQQYVQSLGAADTTLTPVVVTNTVINDRFNTYPAESHPHRFVYDIKVKGRQYRVTTVILKQDNSWKIDDFQGSYK
jgi:hypothetical protein